MRNRFIEVGVLLCLGAAALSAASFPEPPKESAPAEAKATAVLAGGCFWGMQGIYEHMKGVTETSVGFAGGDKKTALYDTVSEGNTGHAESIKITYDTTKISYGDLLKVFFAAAHDPTTLNRQHYDVGTQYRSVIFYANDDQKKMAESYIAELNNAHVFKSPIVTQVLPLKGFYAADGPDREHQHFLDHNPTQGYIAAVDIPLQKEFKEKFPEFWVKESK
jgi:peptide-methionine (S)-S-oxide reductase